MCPDESLFDPLTRLNCIRANLGVIIIFFFFFGGTVLPRTFCFHLFRLCQVSRMPAFKTVGTVSECGVVKSFLIR